MMGHPVKLALGAALVAGSLGVALVIGSGPAEEAGSPLIELGTAEDGRIRLLEEVARPVELTLRNLADRPRRVALRTPADEVEVHLPEGPLLIPAGGSRDVVVNLTASFPPGARDRVQLDALDPEGGSRLGGGDVPVDVDRAPAPHLEVRPALPGAVPGRDLRIVVRMHNPATLAQSFDLSATGDASPGRDGLRVRGEGSASAVIEVPVPAHAEGNVSLAVAGQSAPGRRTRQRVSLPVVESGEWLAAPVMETLEVAPGESAAVPVTIVANRDRPADARVTGPHVEGETILEIPDRGAQGGFVEIEVPRNASAPWNETLRVRLGNDMSRTVHVRVDPHPEGSVARLGMDARVDLVARLTDGRVVRTTLPEIAHGPFEAGPVPLSTANLTPTTIALDPEHGRKVSDGLLQTATGLREGQARSRKVPPADAYGRERVHVNVSAVTAIRRERTLGRVFRDVPVTDLPSSVDLSRYDVGDVIRWRPREETTIAWRLLEKSETSVTLKRQVEVGDRVPVYPSWPNATRVIDVGASTYRVRTTPPGSGPYVWTSRSNPHTAHWGRTTRVAEVTDAVIRLRHDPTEGLTYREAAAEGGGNVAYRVEAVGNGTVHLTYDNPSPLAGRTVIFDVVLRQAEASLRPGGDISPVD